MRLCGATYWQLAKFTVKELRAYAKRLHLRVNPEARKDDLVDMIWKCGRVKIGMTLEIDE